MNVALLKQKIAECGLTGEEIASAIDVDPSTYYRKLNAEGETFTVAQVKKLAETLHLTGSEASIIFLT